MKTKLQDPRKYYSTKEFIEQEQKAPALQKNMTPQPDCGEETYVGNGELENRSVLITGGDSGIGRAVAIACAREGANVAIQFLPGEEPDAIEVRELIEKAGRKAVLLPYDLKDEMQAHAMVDMAVKGLGSLDTLILNAAQQKATENIQDLSLAQIHDTFAVNFFSMIEAVKAAEKYLPAGASIITTTSVQSFNPTAYLIDYAATKAAITNFTINLSQIMIDKGIRVNGVAPGPIWTPLQLDHGQPAGKISKFGQSSIIGRAGQPAELASVYVFLASNNASYVTGQIYGVTGGEAINP
ncbi:SDR family oxidoreductase [Weissella muntiaci]|uniref:SDR family oxidoreductase n=2 Tax=Weissella muntiaci TaxID=2508881 RepID=A0A6C2C4Z1_9LACO|nr:SDR family oxidoreductase [Weissella muntiaci]